MRFKIASYYSEVIDGGENLAKMLIIISPNLSLLILILLLFYAFPKPLSRPLSRDMDHEADNPAGRRATDTSSPVSESELLSLAQHPYSVDAESEHTFGISYPCHSDATLSRKSLTGGCLNMEVFNLHALRKGLLSCTN